jgi:putative ABC transport system substrate-binding protein
VKRREFIILLGGTAATWPLAAHAQQPDRVRRVGVLRSSTDQESRSRFDAFAERLQVLGWVQGRSIRIDHRLLGGDGVAAARELVALAPDAILLTSNPAVAALRKVDQTIPAVFVQVGDPVGSGFVKSLAHPGGNLTGFTTFEPAIGGKWLELLKEIAPAVTRALVILQPDITANHAFLRAAEAGAPTHKIAVGNAAVRDAAEIERAIANFAREPNGGLVALPNPVTYIHRELIADLAIRHRLPAISAFRYMVVSGTLMSYGVDVLDLYRRAAGYIDRILRGTKPGDLPVELPTKFELLINLKTAKTIGLAIPELFLVRADEVIE